VCGDFALDGHITCGRARCQEGAQRHRLTPRALFCLAYLADGRLCGESATAVDVERGIVVCAEHAPPG
jgi:hypothetical protein